MQCEQQIDIFPEGGEQQVDVNPEKSEDQVTVNPECLRVTPIEDKDYNKFYNKPQINGVELIGNKLSKEIHVQHEMERITEQNIDEIIYA